MNKYPFQKLLVYFIVIAKHDRVAFGNLVESYLPSIRFDHESPFEFIQSYLGKFVVPKCILNGTYRSIDLNAFCKHHNLLDLHSVFNNEEFQDFLFDTDKRRKLDGMALSSVFRKIDILREFGNINPLFIEVYLSCFADYTGIPSKNSFINNYIGDVNEKNLYNLVVSNTSRNHLRVILGIKLSDVSPQELVTEALNMIKLKAQTALLSGDDVALERWLKLQLTVSDKLQKLGAGNRDDMSEFLSCLKAEPDFADPVIYTKEQLDSMISANS